MVRLLFITNSPEFARMAADCGVDRIFVDLEIIGKEQRQGHLSTVISRHSLEDVRQVRRAVPGVELMVRLNPIHAGTPAEVESALTAGADLLMLPMFRRLEEVEKFSQWVAGRARVVPLVETKDASDVLPQVVRLPGVAEIYIGLNDLHLDLNQEFMFQPLADGSVERMARVINAAGLPYGFGGIARVDEGRLPAELILAEHLRLGSSRVILSRTFFRKKDTSSEGLDSDAFKSEIQKLRQRESDLLKRTPAQQETDRLRVVALVKTIIEDNRRG